MAKSDFERRAREQLAAIYTATEPLYRLRDRMFENLNRELNAAGVLRRSVSELKESETKELRVLFRKDIMPLLSPQIIDSTHPFPHLINKQLHIAVRLESKRKQLYGLIPVPPSGRAYAPIGAL